MNCRPGDLAVVVSGMPRQNVGKVITVTRIAFFGCIWEYEGELIGPIGRLAGVDDACLRPLRDNDGTDETLTWRDVPRKVAA